uniref:Uncharacterized protein n=1 Tax=Magallana gigas TaxID=29159 RepID=A0A8W8KHP9_MAGGI
MVLIYVGMLLIAGLITNISSSAEDLEDGICDEYSIIPQCCTGFVYNDTLMQCIACVGRFGTNCSQSCPLGYYGRQCSQTCSCNITLCDNVSGCSEAASDEGMVASSLVRYSDVGHPLRPPELVVEQNDVIYVNTMMLQKLNNKKFLTTCCSNDENVNIHKNNDTIRKICKACIGHPCRKCPWGYYGEKCNELCTCGTELCHDVLGCVTAACVGKFGTNCSQSCPQGYYGRRCSQTCSCNITLCDNVLGCSEAASDEGMMAISLVGYSDVGHPMKPPELVVEQNDVIYVNTMMLQKLNNKRFLTTCCSNDENANIHNNDTLRKICEVCIGHPCRKCPWGYYGEQCNETCTCSTELCHDVLGCVTAEDTSTSVNEKNTEYITRDSPVIYAAVVRPNRKPVRSVEQSDLMYGKMPKPQTSDQERDNKAKCLDINISNNPEGEGLKIGFSTTYSFVRNPDRTLSQDLGQCDQAYGNMTTRV